jgi:small subunit ribosomal protein S3
MGSKVHPKLFRLSTVETWDSTWFSKANFRRFLREDVLMRAFLKKKFREAGIHKIAISRSRKSVTININTAKPGFVIGRAGSGVEELKKELMKKYFRGTRTKLNINVQDIGQGALSAAVVAEQIAMDIEKRMPFRRVGKQAVDRVMKAGAQGVRVIIGGRLNGADIARAERFQTGKIPLQNLRADIKYHHAEAATVFGVIGVKVWIYRGEVFGDAKEDAPAPKRGRERTNNRTR